MSYPDAKIKTQQEMRNEMNDKLEMPKDRIAELVSENLVSAKYYREIGNAVMADWHEGRATAFQMLIDVWG